MGDLDKVKQSQAAKAKNLADWRASRLIDIEDMPSGMPGVVIRDIGLMDVFLMDDVDIPNVMMEMMLENDKKQIKEEEDAVSDNELVIDMMKNKTDFTKMLNEIVRVAWVEPPIGQKADGKHITLSEIQFDDKMRIFNFLSQEAQEAGKFPDEQESSENTLPVRSVQPETE